MIAQNKVAGWLVGAAGLLILGACAGGSVQVTSVSSGGVSNCRAANWYEVGFEDGTRGFPTEKVQEYRRCPAIAQQATLDAYRAGWDDGIARYCTEENGFVVAANGNAQVGNCPRSQSRGFRKGRRLGTNVFEQNQSIAEKSAAIEVLDQNIRSGRFSPNQVERLVTDRRKLLDTLAKDQRELDKLLRTARQRRYPLG